MKNQKLTTKLIPFRYFNELKNRGNTVPRNEKTGDLIPFKVGAEYFICFEKNGQPLRVKCTQNCPYNLRLISPHKEETHFISFLDKSKGFKQTDKYFTGPTGYDDAVKWGKKNLDNYHPDLIKDAKYY